MLDLDRLFRRLGAFGAVGAHEANDRVVGADGIVLDDLADADVVVVGREGDVLALQLRVGSRQHANDVASGVARGILLYRGTRRHVLASASRGQRAERGHEQAIGRVR